jgi:hypothetical protein
LTKTIEAPPDNEQEGGGCPLLLGQGRESIREAWAVDDSGYAQTAGNPVVGVGGTDCTGFMTK